MNDELNKDIYLSLCTYLVKVLTQEEIIIDVLSGD